MNKNIISTKKIKRNWIYLLISQPDLYLFKLIFNSVVVGGITMLLNYIVIRNNLKFHVPSTAHQLVSIAIGLLLVFRTTTAYERWSSANKHFNEIYNSLVFLVFKIDAALSNVYEEEKEKRKQEIEKMIKSFSDNLRNYLKTDDDDLARTLEIAYLEDLRKFTKFISLLEKDGYITHSDTIALQKIISEIIAAAGSCVKIKNTPIPTSYTLHIKVSIFLYILSLPFGLFSDLGMWSPVMVSVIYYIIAGIEIISKEIEQPFYGDPNDLPVDTYIKNMQQITTNHFN